MSGPSCDSDIEPDQYSRSSVSRNQKFNCKPFNTESPECRK